MSTAVRAAVVAAAVAVLTPGAVVLWVATVAVAVALAVSVLFWVASAWRGRRGRLSAGLPGPVAVPDDDGPVDGCDCGDCDDLDDDAVVPMARPRPALTRRQVARRFAAIAHRHPDLRVVEREVTDLYLIPEELT